MKRLLARIFLAFGETPKDGVSNIAAGLFGLGGLGAYSITNNLIASRYAPIVGVATFVAGGLTSWATGKSDDLGLR